MKFLGCYLRLTDLNMLCLSKEQLIERIKYLPRLDTLFLLSRIDVFLTKNNQTANNIQEILVEKIFSAEIATKIKIILKSGKYKAVFYSQQIYYCMGLVLEYGHDEYRADVNKLLPALGEILLFTSEFCDDDSILENEQEKTKQLVGRMWRIGHYYNSLNLDIGMELSRMYLLYNSVEGKAFSDEFKLVTGIDLNSFWKVVCIVYLKCLSSDDFLTTGFIVEKNEFFPHFEGISVDEINKSIALISANINQLRDVHRGKINAFGNENYNFEFLRDKPLLEFEPGRYICLSMPYLIRKITSGILEIVKEILGTKTFDDKLRDVLGKCYESYVANLTKDTYSTPFAERFFKRKYNKIEISDGVIDYGDRLIFMEVKAVSIQKRYRLSENYSMVEEALRPFLTRKGAVQLDKRIMEFKTGKIKINEINHNKIRYYYPVLIVCLDSLPMYSVLSEEYMKILQKNNLLQQWGVCRLTIITLREYEYIMKLVEQGESFVEIIKGKNSSKESQQMSMLNFLILNYKDRDRPQHLQTTLVNFLDDIREAVESQISASLEKEDN